MPDDTTTAAEAIQKAVTEALSRLGRSREPDDDPATKGQSVPYHQFARAQDRAKAAEEALAAIQEQVGALSTAHDARVTALQEEAAKQVGALQSRHVNDLALVDLGFTDPDGREALRLHWGRLDEKARGDSEAAYWAQAVKAHQAHLADPEKAEAPTLPRTLTPYLPAPEQRREEPARRSSIFRGPDANTRTGPPPGVADRFAGAKTLAEVMAAAQEADRNR